MDGLTIRNTDQMLNLERGTIQRTGNDLVMPEVKISGGESADSFGAYLKDAVSKVNELHKEADRKTEELATGKTTNIAEVMIATEKADIALRTLLQVRNKIIDAYQEVMKMQV